MSRKERLRFLMDDAGAIGSAGIDLAIGRLRAAKGKGRTRVPSGS